MKREDVKGLYYISHRDNLDSILRTGILSHDRAESVPHTSVALESVQQLRAKVWLPNVKRLHSHVNLYFDARNPMLCFLQDSHHLLVVIRISPDVLDTPGTWITDGNAAIPSRTGFYPATASSFEKLEEKWVYAESWENQDELVKKEQKRRKCAEVLVPEIVPPSFFTAIYCSCSQVLESLQTKHYTIDLNISERMFFK